MRMMRSAAREWVILIRLIVATRISSALAVVFGECSGKYGSVIKKCYRDFLPLFMAVAAPALAGDRY